jgi:hypothetical protein
MKKILLNKTLWIWLTVMGVAIFWRFWHFETRWVFNQDQGRDATIALHALRNGLVPVIGSPSSAGPFNFGPWYFWLIMGLEKLIPSLMGPWIGFTVLSTVSVLLYADIGRKLAGNTGLLIAGLVAATAYGPVFNSTDMLNTVIVGTSSALALWATMKYVKEDKVAWTALAGAAVGWSINFHFQSLGLLGLLLSIFLVNKFDVLKRIKVAGVMGVGFLATFIPLIWFDLNNHFIWINSVIEYYTVGVKKFYVPVRWLTEIRDFWPQLLGSVTTGIPWFGYAIGLLFVIATGMAVAEKLKVERYWLLVGVSLLIQVGLIRFYKGVRSQEYLIAIHGYLILLTTWTLIMMEKQKKLMGIMLMLPILCLAAKSNLDSIRLHPSQAKTILEIKKALDTKVPGEVVIKNYKQSDMASTPLFYLYYRENRISDKGTEIGVCDANRYVCPMGGALDMSNYKIYMDEGLKWDLLTSENIYNRLMVNYGK